MQPLLLTVGNIYIDHNIYGVDSGDELNLKSGKDYFAESGDRVLGGSAVNVAMQAKKLKLNVGFVGKTGTDSGAKEVLELLESHGILSDLITKDINQTTSMAINLIGKNGEFVGVHYGGASRTLALVDIDLEHDLFNRCNAIYFGGTAKQPKLFSDCTELFSILKSKGIKIFYDPNRFPAQEVKIDSTLLMKQLSFVEGYFPNEEEIIQATGKTNLEEALQEVIDTGVKFVALKLGAKGCRIKTKNNDFVVEGKTIKVVSTVGAGDCFNATFMAYYLNGSSLNECAEKATSAAAIKVSQNIWPNIESL